MKTVEQALEDAKEKLTWHNAHPIITQQVVHEELQALVDSEGFKELQRTISTKQRNPENSNDN